MPTLAQQFKEEGKIEGIEIGVKKGKEEEKIETAEKMLEDGLPIKMIAKYTGLDISEIEELKKDPSTH